MSINKKRENKVEASAHKNFMGGNSWDISNPLVKLRIAASSCFFGEPMYYHRDKKDDKQPFKRSGYASAYGLSGHQVDHLRSTLNAMDPRDWRGMSPTDLMVKAIDEALDFDAEATLQEAARLRNEEHMRTTPQVILVRAAHNPKVRRTGLVRKYAPEIIKRADEPAVQMAYCLEAYGVNTAIPNSLKNAWRDALQKFNDYQLAKYRMEDRVVKTVDVVNLVHPKSESVSKLCKGELKTTGETWEAIISAEGSNKQSWMKALDSMGHMALLRNLRNLTEKGVDPKIFLNQLVNGAPTGKQLPFRYVSAYEAVKHLAPGGLLDAIESCLKASLGNLPKFSGRVMSLCDNSGSARSATTSSMGTMPVSTIANLTGVITGMCSDDGYVGVFGDRLTTFSIRKSSSVFDQLGTANRAGDSVGGGTENGVWLFWAKAIREKEHWDNVFIYSDMQAGHGGLYGTNPGDYRDYLWTGGRHIDVAKLVTEYRRQVNHNVNVFLVQVAGYQDTIIPEFYNRTYILGGWGEGLLRFAAEMIGMYNERQD